MFNLKSKCLSVLAMVTIAALFLGATTSTLINLATQVKGVLSAANMNLGAGLANDGTGKLTTVGQQPAQITAGPICPSACSNSQVVLYIPITTSTTIPSSCTNSKAYAATAATGSTTFQMYDLSGGPIGGSTNFGSFAFSSSGQTATFTCASSQTLAAGDVLKIVGPSTADATLATIGVNLNATR